VGRNEISSSTKLPEAEVTLITKSSGLAAEVNVVVCVPSEIVRLVDAAANEVVILAVPLKVPELEMV
jgi:hypothetical protein